MQHKSLAAAAAILKFFVHSDISVLCLKIRVRDGAVMPQGQITKWCYGSRPHDADRFEVSQHKWTALAETNRGFALLNDCKYGVAVKDQTISLTLLRSPSYPDETSDQGTQHFTYGFLFWDGRSTTAGLLRRLTSLIIRFIPCREQAA